MKKFAYFSRFLPTNPCGKFEVVSIEMPPCSEEIDIAENQIYMVFESAGEKYFEGTDGKGKSVSPIDKVLTLAKNSIFQ